MKKEILITILLSIIFFIAAAINLINTQKFISAATKLEGEIINVDTKIDSKGMPKYELQIKYNLNNKSVVLNQFTYREEFSSIGKKVDIYYTPNQIKVSFNDLYTIVEILNFSGIMVLFMGGIIIISRKYLEKLRQKESMKKLETNQLHKEFIEKKQVKISFTKKKIEIFIHNLSYILPVLGFIMIFYFKSGFISNTAMILMIIFIVAVSKTIFIELRNIVIVENGEKISAKILKIIQNKLQYTYIYYYEVNGKKYEGSMKINGIDITKILGNENNTIEIFYDKKKNNLSIPEIKVFPENYLIPISNILLLFIVAILLFGYGIMEYFSLAYIEKNGGVTSISVFSKSFYTEYGKLGVLSFFISMSSVCLINVLIKCLKKYKYSKKIVV